MGNKFCFNCGARLEENDKFCMSCGTKQPAPKAENTNNAVNVSNERNINNANYSGNVSSEPFRTDMSGGAGENVNASPLSGFCGTAFVESPISPKTEIMKKKGLGSWIIGVIITFSLIFGGLSGEYVLRFTNSSTALVIFGFACLVWDIIRLIAYIKAEPPKGFSGANYAVVIKTRLDKELKRRAKSANMSYQEYAAYALTSLPAPQKLEELGVAFVLGTDTSLVFVSKSREYLENELVPTFNPQRVFDEYGVNAEIEGVLPYNTAYSVIGNIKNGKLNSTLNGPYIVGINRALNKNTLK